MVIYYDPHYYSITSLFVLKGTVLHAVIFDLEFWFHVGLHSFCAIWFWTYRDDYYVEHYVLPDDAWKLTLTLNTFLAVFFSSQCYSRYWDIYNNCQSIDESLKLFVRELDTFMWQKSVRRHVKTAIKYMLSAVFLFYFTLSDGGRIDEEEWTFMKERGLLTEEEIALLGPNGMCGAIKGYTLTSWAVRCAQTAMRTPDLRKLFSPPECAALMNRIDGEAVTCTICMRNISDLLALPVPYAYFHLLSLVMVLNFWTTNWYLVFAFRTPWTILPYACSVLMFLGIRCVSASLADPFRPESTDKLGCAMPSLAFLNNAYHNAVALVETIEDGHPFPEPRCDFDEEWVEDETDYSPRGLIRTISRSPDFKSAPTVKDLKQQRNCHRKWCVGEQTHVAFQWKSSQVGTYVEGWLKRVRGHIEEEEEEALALTEAQIDKPAAAAPKRVSLQEPVEEEQPKLSVEEIQMMNTIQKLANQQRTLFTVVSRLLGEDASDASCSTEPIPSTISSPLLGKLPKTGSNPELAEKQKEKKNKANSPKSPAATQAASAPAKMQKGTNSFGGGSKSPTAKKVGKGIPPAG